MKSKWKPVTEPVYVMPDGSWHFAVDHTSWMGDDYMVVDYGIVCEEHGNWAKYECPECLLSTLDRNNTTEVTFFPHAGQSFNIPDQLVKGPNNVIWAVRDRQFKFKWSRNET